MENKLDRTTRLVVSLTIFGATWYILLGAIKLWYATFSQSAYIKSILNFEHILAVTVLTVVSAVTIAFIKYLYLELQTYQSFDDDKLKEVAESKADMSYSDIFKTVKNSLYGVGALVVIFIIIYVLLKPISLISLLIGFVIAVLIFGVGLILGKNKLRKFIDYTEKIEKKASPFFKLLYLLTLFLMIGISISILSLNSNKQIEVSIVEEGEIPIEVKIHNINQPTLFVNIEREENSVENIQLVVSSEEMESSFVEVFDDSNGSLLADNNRYYFNQSKVLNRTSLELFDFILEGKNILELIIVSEERAGNKSVRIVTVFVKIVVAFHLFNSVLFFITSILLPRFACLPFHNRTEFHSILL